jgi:hypothetical protein
MLVELYGRTVPAGVRVRLLNISRSGMALRTELPLPTDIPHCFELTLLDRTTVRLSGEITRRRAGPGDWFTIGVSFTKPATVAPVLRRITAGTVIREEHATDDAWDICPGTRCRPRSRGSRCASTA